MLTRMCLAAAALALVTGCEVAQRGPAAIIPGLPETASWRQPEGSYVFNDGSRRFTIELDEDWTVDSSIEKGAYAPNARRVSRAADDRVTELKARYHATTPRREVAVMTVGFAKTATPAAEQAKQLRAAETARCPAQALPEVPPVKTKDGKIAHVILRCPAANGLASAQGFVEDAAASPSFVVVHGAQGDYARQPVLHKEVLDDFLEVLKSYKSGS